MVRFSQLSVLLNGQLLQLINDEPVEYLITDSRKTIASTRSVFFAIKGVRNDGHEHIASCYEQGILQFVIERAVEYRKYPNANFIKVQSTVAALQQLVIHHRKQFNYPVIGITGSNGKTIVKEWLYQLLSSDYKCVKNPGSYNSQIGVPLSVWQMSDQHELGIFEAGISLPGEMESLQKIIQPTIGVFTNIGKAHDEGFTTNREKLIEKLKLFSNTQTIIYCGDQKEVGEVLAKNLKPDKKLIAWGQNSASNVLLKFTNGDSVSLSGLFGDILFDLPFADEASKQNVLHCIVVMLHLGYSSTSIQERVNQLHGISMRLELKQGINYCQLVDDTYNNDLGGLQIGLDFLGSLNLPKRTLILSDILQSGLTLEQLSLHVSTLLKENNIQKFIGIGFGFHSHQNAFDELPIEKYFYLTTEDFIHGLNQIHFEKEAILLKGARVFKFEKIVSLLQKKIHGTVMEINQGALIQNLNYFKSLLQPNVKLMVMVKAFAYGSGSNEIASLLQYHNVDYLGVAYTDEGVELRNHHVKLPIMVMNPSEDAWQVTIDNDLEPEIYSMSLLRSLIEFLEGRSQTVHLKIDTGMHRLGFDGNDLDAAINLLKENPNVKVGSVFSHLAGADDPTHDAFSAEQASKLQLAVNLIRSKLAISPLVHLLNSSGILRFPAFQYDMVRLGIGLYGIDPGGTHANQLQPVATLKTVISQIKRVPKGESIGYSRAGRAQHPMVIATVAIGYADGYSRHFGNGVGYMLVRGMKAPVVGNVCMDMTMLDVSEINDVSENDEVIVFGGELPIQELASKAATIPYEILTSTSERVKRVFYAESI